MQSTKPVCDSQNLQFGCNSQINLPRDCKDLSLFYSRNVVRQDQHYSTKKLLLGFVANKQSLLFKAKLIYLLKIKTIFILDEKLKVFYCIDYFSSVIGHNINKLKLQLK